MSQQLVSVQSSMNEYPWTFDSPHKTKNYLSPSMSEWFPPCHSPRQVCLWSSCLTRPLIASFVGGLLRKNQQAHKCNNIQVWVSCQTEKALLSTLRGGLEEGHAYLLTNDPDNYIWELPYVYSDMHIYIPPCCQFIMCALLRSEVLRYSQTLRLLAYVRTCALSSTF